MDTPFLNSRRKLSQGLLFWREVGKGIPVLFLHGAWKDSSEWVSVMDSLSQDFHCLAPDLLGFGESEFPNIHYSIDLQLQCLSELLEALKLEKVYLVGHSLGGWVAASYALKYPEKIHGLVLLAPEGVEIQGQKNHWQKMQSLVKRSPIVFSLLRLLRPLAKIFRLDINVEEERRLQKLMLQNPTACEILFQRKHPEIAAEFLQERLYSMVIPVLILQGGKDTPVALAMSQTYAQMTPKASLKMIAHVAGDLPQSCSGLVAADIRDFIKGGE